MSRVLACLWLAVFGGKDCGRVYCSINWSFSLLPSPLAYGLELWLVVVSEIRTSEKCLNRSL